jgi:uncharacterized membrane protein YhhN
MIPGRAGRDRLGLMPRPRVLLALYVAVSVVHVLSFLAAAELVATVTKPLLMPLLAAYLLSESRRPFTRMVRVVLGALAFSWLGDVLLQVASFVDADVWFLAGIGAFLVAQVLYIVAFTPLVRAGTPPRPPLWALLYVPYGAVLIGVLAPDLGEFLVPAAIYAVVICTMGIVAAGVNRWTALGAAVFVLSDSLLAAGALAGVLPFTPAWQRVLVMATYTLAQGLIVYGVVVAQRRIGRPVEPVEPAEV